MIVGLAHVNLIVPKGTLGLAEEFYGNTLGLTPRPVPHLQKHMLAWYDIGTSGQQVHIAFGPQEVDSSRHPCFKLESPEKLVELQNKVWEHYERKDESSPRAADKPGEVNSGRYITAFDYHVSKLTLVRFSRCRISFTVLCERLCGQQTRI